MALVSTRSITRTGLHADNYSLLPEYPDVQRAPLRAPACNVDANTQDARRQQSFNALHYAHRPALRVHVRGGGVALVSTRSITRTGCNMPRPKRAELLAPWSFNALHYAHRPATPIPPSIICRPSSFQRAPLRAPACNWTEVFLLEVGFGFNALHYAHRPATEDSGLSAK